MATQRGFVAGAFVLTWVVFPRTAISDVPPTPDLARLGTSPFGEFSVAWGSHYFDGIPWETREYDFGAGVPVWGPVHLLGDIAVAEAGDADYAKDTEFGNVGVEVATRHVWTRGPARWYAGGGLRTWLPTATGYDTSNLGSFSNPPNRLNSAHHTYDPGRFAPYTLTLRPGVALARETKWAFVQIDAGADVFVPMGEPQPAQTEFGYHLGGAAGLYVGPFTGYAELARFDCATCALDPHENDTLGLDGPVPTSLVVGFRAAVGPVSLGVAIRDNLGRVAYLHGIPLRLDLFVRF